MELNASEENIKTSFLDIEIYYGSIPTLIMLSSLSLKENLLQEKYCGLVYFSVFLWFPVRRHKL